MLSAERGAYYVDEVLKSLNLAACVSTFTVFGQESVCYIFIATLYGATYRLTGTYGVWDNQRIGEKAGETRKDRI